MSCLTEPTGIKDSFEDAETLVGHMEIVAKTPLALVTFKHLAYLGYIAGLDITRVKRKMLEEEGWFSLHAHQGIVVHARERLSLSKGLVPTKNWFGMFSEQIDKQSKTA